MFQRKFAQRSVELEEDQEGFVVKHINKCIGKGVFSKRTFQKGDFLLEYSGEFISYQEGERREKTYPLKLGSFIYFLTWNDKQYCIDATFSNQICKYVNDGIGQSQNCIMKLEVFNTRPHLCLYAKKDIAVGDELRYDYGVAGLTWRKKEKPKVAKNRGRSAEKPSRTQEKTMKLDSNNLKVCTRSSSKAKKKSFRHFRILFPRNQFRKSSRNYSSKVNSKKTTSKCHRLQRSSKEYSRTAIERNDKNAKIRKDKTPLLEEKNYTANLRKLKGVEEQAKAITKITDKRKEINSSAACCQPSDAKSDRRNNSKVNFEDLVIDKSMLKGNQSDSPNDQSISETEIHELSAVSPMHKGNKNSFPRAQFEKRKRQFSAKENSKTPTSKYHKVQRSRSSKEYSPTAMDRNDINPKAAKKRKDETLLGGEKYYIAKLKKLKGVGEQEETFTKTTDNKKQISVSTVCCQPLDSKSNNRNNSEINVRELVIDQSMLKENRHQSDSPNDQSIAGTEIHELSAVSPMHQGNKNSFPRVQFKKRNRQYSVKENSKTTTSKCHRLQRSSKEYFPTAIDRNDINQKAAKKRKDKIPLRGKKYYTAKQRKLKGVEEQVETFTKIADNRKQINVSTACCQPLDSKSNGRSNSEINVKELVIDQSMIKENRHQSDSLNDQSIAGIEIQELSAVSPMHKGNKNSFPRIQFKKRNRQYYVKKNSKTTTSKCHNLQRSSEKYSSIARERNDIKQTGAKKRKVKTPLGEEKHYTAKLNKALDAKSDRRNNSEINVQEIVNDPSLQKEKENSSDSHQDRNIPETDIHELVAAPSLYKEKRYSSDSPHDQNVSETDIHELVADPSVHKGKNHSSDSPHDLIILGTDFHELTTESPCHERSEKQLSHETSSLPSCFVKLDRLSLKVIGDLGYETMPMDNCSKTYIEHNEVHQTEDVQDREENNLQILESLNNINTVTKQLDTVSDRPSLLTGFQVDDAGRCLEQAVEQPQEGIAETHNPNTNQEKVKSQSEGVGKKAKPFRPCLFCGLKQSKLTRHLKTKHRHVDRIRGVLRLPKQLQHQEFDQIKKEGILKANKDIMKNAELGSKEVKEYLMRERRQGKGDVAVCSLCNGFYAANTIHKHKRSCMEAEATTREPVSLPVSLIANTGNVQYRDEILSKFRNDEIGNLCRTDNFIKLLGFQTYVKIKSREEKKFELRDSLMSEMRRFAHLFLEFKSLAEGNNLIITSSIDMLARDNFTYLEEAITNITTNEDGTIKCGLKAGIGFLLKKTAKVLKGQYLIQKEDEKAREVDNFLIVLQHFWTAIFSDAQYANVKARQTDLRKPKHLPNEQDIVKLREFIMAEQKTLLDQYVVITNKEYKRLRDILVCRLTLFNARRGGEPSRLMLKEWRDAEEDVWITDSAVQRIDDPIEKHMIGQYKIAYQSGKNLNQMVPLLIPNDCIKGLQILASKETRSSAGVHSKNIFLFPSTMSSEHHIKGWNAVDNVCKRAGIESRINATSVRHRAATLYASLDVPDKERELFYKHMGHSEEINRHVYQCPLAVQEVTKVGKFFQNLDRPLSSCVGTFHSGETSTNREHMAEETGHKEQCTADSESYNTRSVKPKQSATPLVDNDGSNDDSDIDDSDDDEDYRYDEDTGEDSGSSGEDDNCSDDEISFKIERKRAVKRFSWSDEDTSRVQEYFSEWVDDTSTFDRKGSLPGKTMIVKFLRKYPNILCNMDMKKRVSLMRTKLYNERNKSRSLVSKHLSTMLR